MHKFFAMLGFLVALSIPAIAHSQSTPAQQLEAAFNQVRSANGSTVLPAHPYLEAAALQKANLMSSSGCWSLNCVGQPNTYRRLVAAGYYAGFQTEFTAVDSASPLDFANATLASIYTHNLMLRNDWADIGCAFVNDGAHTFSVCIMAYHFGATPPTDYRTSHYDQYAVAPQRDSSASHSHASCSNCHQHPYPRLSAARNVLPDVAQS